MQQYLPYVLFIIGFIMIIKGSDWFIDSTIWIAKVFNVPNIIIGATLVSICTTLPEAMVSGSSALKGNSDIAFGNAIGSIACNTGFILGINILLSTPPIKEAKSFIRKGIFLISLILVLIVNGLVFGEITRNSGLILLLLLLFYLVSNIKGAIKKPDDHDEQDQDVDKSKQTIIKNTVLFIIGIILTIWGANILVENGEKIARMLGVPDVVIGLTLTAFGTSLPEFVTSITAIVKKAPDISVGNILGANLLNILLVIGLSSTILPIKMDPTYSTFHLPFVGLIVALPIAGAVIHKTKFKRITGITMLIAYGIYMYITVGVLS